MGTGWNRGSEIMSLIVQKFGGSSVADLEKIRHVSSRVKQYHDAGHRLVMVFSAMGKTTDRLLEMARKLHPSAPERKVDVPPLVSRSPLPWLRLHSMSWEWLPSFLRSSPIWLSPSI
ncbi:MAG: hypothetical protein WCP87_03020 [Atribacterota bacterium]